MKTVLKGLTSAALLAGLLAAPAAAQQRSWAIGIHAGRLNSGSLAESGNTQLELDNDWTYGASLEKWFGSRRIGLRLDGDYTRQPFQLETDVDGTREDEINNELTALGRVNTWYLGGDLVLRLLSPSVDRRFAPFVSLGAGYMRFDHPDSDDTTNDIRIPEADVQIYNAAQSEGAVTGSIGADFFLNETVALRIEAKDYWNPDSPYIMLSRINEQDDRHHNGAHNVIWRAGLTFNFGGARVEEPGFIAVTPEPAPPVVTPAPAPPPAPTTEQVSMCVVDANGRLQMVSATRNLQNRNVYVTRNGQEVLFSTAYPATDPIYVKGAPWYIAARPLVLDLDDDDMGGDVDDELDDAAENLPANRVEFVNFGSTQPLPMGDVLYIGSIDGTPLYATRSDIGGLLPDLEARLRVTTDLDDVLDDEAFADRFVNEIQTFYTAVEPGSANCVFQPMSSTHVVRRTRG